MLKRQVENYETQFNLQSSDDSVQNLKMEQGQLLPVTPHST